MPLKTLLRHLRADHSSKKKIEFEFFCWSLKYLVCIGLAEKNAPNKRVRDDGRLFQPNQIHRWETIETQNDNRSEKKCSASATRKHILGRRIQGCGPGTPSKCGELKRGKKSRDADSLGLTMNFKKL